MAPKKPSYAELERRVAELEKAQEEARQREEELLTNQQFFSGVFDHLPGAVVFLDPAHRVVKWNPGAERLFGYSAQEARGCELDTLISQSDVLSEAQEYTERIQSGDILFPVEAIRYRKDGTHIHVIVSGAPILIDGLRQGTVAIYLDITEWKWTQKSLCEREQRLRELYELAPVGIFQSSPDDRYVHVNPAFARIYGFDSAQDVLEQITSISSQIYVSPQEREKLLSLMQETRYLENYELCARSKSGDIIWVLVNMREVRDIHDNLAHYEGYVSDITARKKVEETLLEYAHVIKATRDLMAVLDEERRYTMVNAALLENRGLEESEVLGRYIWDIVGRDVYETYLRQPLNRCYQGHSVQFEVEFDFDVAGARALEIKLSPVFDQVGQVCRVASVSSDITERKEAENALKKSEERFKLAMEATRDGLWDWDLQTDQVYYSPGYAAMLGYSKEESLSHVNFWKDHIHPEDKDNALKTNLDCIENRCENFDVVFRMLTKHGNWRWILGRGKAVARDNRGQALRMVGTHTDITEHKQAEEEKEQLQAQLFQAQKMKSVGRLAGGVAHELNNLLMGVLGYGEMLLADAKLDTKHKQRVKLMHHAGVQSKNLVQQLLAFGRKQPLRMQSLDLNQVILDFNSLWRKTLRDEVVIQVQLCPQSPYIQADRAQLEQVIVNLADNAQEAMPQGGTLLIETHVLDLSSNCDVHPKKISPGHYALLMVRDTGHGMDSNTLEHVFDPFFTTKEVGQGTGLGLATAYGIVKQHQGHIWAESELRQGTTFKIYLPLVS